MKKRKLVSIASALASALKTFSFLNSIPLHKSNSSKYKKNDSSKIFFVLNFFKLISIMHPVTQSTLIKVSNNLSEEGLTSLLYIFFLGIYFPVHFTVLSPLIFDLIKFCSFSSTNSPLGFNICSSFLICNGYCYSISII